MCPSPCDDWRPNLDSSLGRNESVGKVGTSESGSRRDDRNDQSRHLPFRVVTAPTCTFQGFLRTVYAPNKTTVGIRSTVKSRPHSDLSPSSSVPSTCLTAESLVTRADIYRNVVVDAVPQEPVSYPGRYTSRVFSRTVSCPRWLHSRTVVAVSGVKVVVASGHFETHPGVPQRSRRSRL